MSGDTPKDSMLDSARQPMEINERLRAALERLKESLAKRVELLAQGMFTEEWSKGYKAATIDAAIRIRDFVITDEQMEDAPECSQVSAEWTYTCALNHRPIQFKATDGHNCPLCVVIAKFRNERSKLEKVRELSMDRAEQYFKSRGFSRDVAAYQARGPITEADIEALAELLEDK